MAGPGFAPCSPWCDEADLCPPCDSMYDLARFEEMAEAASWALFMLSGQQYNGVCSAIVRPCSRSRRVRPSSEWPANASLPTASGLPALVYGSPLGWLSSWGFCGCDREDRCGCGSISQIELGGIPIVSVSEVLVDGEALVEGRDWRVDDFRWLVRLGGHGWPCCQRLDLPATEPGTFQVSHTWGSAPPTLGRLAAAELCCELLRACSSDEKCKLPPRTTQVVRQGVTMPIADLVTFLDKGRTGLKTCDLFLKAARSQGAQGGDVLSPDILPAARRVGT